MKIRTNKEIIEQLIDTQKETIINRKVGIKTLGFLDPEMTLVSTIDRQTFQPTNIRVKDRIKEMEEALKIDQLRLKVLEEELELCQKKNTKTQK